MAKTTAIQRSSVRDQALWILRSEILTGELVPGEIYSAVALAERLGASATPIREAMLDLANAGLVDVIRNRGYRIVSLSRRQMEELLDVRTLLEVPAMRWVVERAADEELAALEPDVTEIEQAGREGDTAAFLTSDRTFHLRLLALTGSPKLVDLVRGLRDQTSQRGVRQLADAGHLETVADQHRSLLDALLRRDADEAERLMREHLAFVRSLVGGAAASD
jgi:DNA-binding GntR family transcriptional regulator